MNKNVTYYKTIIGIDLGDTKHAVCVTDKDGNVLKEFTVSNTQKSFIRLTKEYPDSLIAIEVGTHSPWISRCLKTLGATVVVANARKLRAIYTNERKCDRLDAQMLAKIVRLDETLLHPIEHGDEQAQRDFLSIKLRATLVKNRTSLVLAIRGTLKSLGIRLHKASTASFANSVREQLKDDMTVFGMIEPVLEALDSITEQIRVLDRNIELQCKQRYPITMKLRQIAGVGPLTALSFVLHIDHAERFTNVRNVGAYLGLVPRRDQSGKSDKQLPISKTGNTLVRTYLVQAAQYILGPFGPECDLRSSGLKLAARGGKAARRKAIVATARKLAVMMLAMWQQGSDYAPKKHTKAA